MTWNNLPISRKIALLMGTLLVVICGLMVTSYITVNRLVRGTNSINETETISTIMLLREIDHLKWITSLQRFIFDEDMKELDIQVDHHKCTLGKWYYGEDRKSVENRFPQLRKNLSEMDEPHAALHMSADVIRNLKNEGKFHDAKAYYMDVSLRSLGEVQKLLSELNDAMRKDKAAGLEQMRIAEYHSLVELGLAGGLGIILTAVILLVISRTVTAPIIRLATYADKVAAGEYSAHFDCDTVRKDEIGRLASCTGRMVDSMVTALRRADEEAMAAQASSRKVEEALLRTEEAQREAETARHNAMLTVVGHLEDAVHIVSSASTELTTQVEQASQGASESANRLSEAATAMNEMSATVREVARNAGSASAVSAETREKAEAGARVVEKAVRSIEEVHQLSLDLKADMAQLNEHARDITRIMGVISDIADQTNLLALNAAIEAARAGEAGRGFAVVADEVRKLAEKTMTSTQDVGNAIKAIQESTAKSMTGVDNAVERIGEATELANQSGHALQEIVATAEVTSDQVNAIATASEEQSAAGEEINQSIVQANDRSRQTAEVMIQAAQAVSDLAAQAQRLMKLIRDMKTA